MINYTIKHYSNLDTNLIKGWEYSNTHAFKISNWEKYLKSLPGVKNAYNDVGETHILFDNESELNMFLLRWS